MNKKSVQKMSLPKEIKILAASILVILLLAFSLYKVTKVNEELVLPEGLIRDFNHKQGPDSAKVKVVEFYDPECEGCSAFYPHLKSVLAQFKDQVQLITRYTLYHGNSVLAAKATEAAAEQGKYWEYQEKLFVDQAAWSHQEMPATEYFIVFAQELGLDLERFKSDLASPESLVNINIDIEDAKKFGVQGTPTLFVNGRKMESVDPDLLKSMIEEELKK